MRGTSAMLAIADVLFGKQSPSGKLSLTFPKAEEDVPSYGHLNSENGQVCKCLYDDTKLRCRLVLLLTSDKLCRRSIRGQSGLLRYQLIIIGDINIVPLFAFG